MKTLWISLLALAVLAIDPSAFAEGKHLFILSGQSNMARFNEQVTFIPAVEAEFGEANVIVVKDAHGGRPIRRWYKGWEAPAKEKNQEIGDLYDRLMAKVKEATEGEELASITVLWMQGEQDTREPTGTLYRASLEGLFQQFETDLERDDLHFVIGRLSDFGIGNGSWPHWEAIRKVQVEVAESSPRIAWVDTDDLNDGLNKKGETVENDLHYTKAGYSAFGRRLAEAAISLIRESGGE